MKPVRALIVDDEPVAREAIRHLLRQRPGVEVVGECRNGHEARQTLAAGGVDLVFLDVQMPVVDGLAVAASLDREAMPAIIFVTAYDEYALQAFEVHAVDYLLKPFTDERFHTAVERALTSIRSGRQRDLTDRLRSLLRDSGEDLTRGGRRYLTRLVIRLGGRATLVHVRDVDWIESDGDYAVIRTGRKRHLIRESMRELAASLDPECFARIHRSTIVNLDRIAEFRSMDKGEFAVVLHDGTELKLSRTFKQSLEAQLGRRL